MSSEPTDPQGTTHARPHAQVPSERGSGELKLAFNSVYNVLGETLPMAVGLWAIPALIRILGTERFGLLTIAWAVIGYFSLFDLGLGRALTKLVAERLGARPNDSIAPLVWTGLTAMLALGLIGAVVMLAAVPWIVRSGLHYEGAMASEAITVLRWLALSVPLVTLTAGLRGVLEAQQRFAELNLLKAPLGVLVFAAPVFATAIEPTLVPVVQVLVLVRGLYCAGLFWLLLKSIERADRRIQLSASELRPMLRFGGWMTVSNIVAPLLVYVDRPLVGHLLGTSEVAYYSTPFEVVTRLTILPASVQGVLFPAFATDLAVDKERATQRYHLSLLYVFLSMYTLTLLVVTLASEGLTLWLGAEFAARSTHVAQLLAVGVLLNGLALVPFGLLHGAGRPEWTAVVHAGELVLYLPAVWLLASNFGIEGAAAAWALRVGVDALLLFWLARRILPSRREVALRALFALGLALLGLWLGASLPSGWPRYAFAGVTVLAFLAVALAIINRARASTRVDAQGAGPLPG